MYNEACREILKSYQVNNSHLIALELISCNLSNGGSDIFSSTIRCCTNLTHIKLHRCNMTDEQLLPMVEVVRENRMLEELDLSENRIGVAGCQALAFLLEDPNSNICTLNLEMNRINVDGAIVIFNSLSKNNCLRHLYLGANPADSQEDFPCTLNALERLLCNTSSINDTYASNHTLETVGLHHSPVKIVYLLRVNNHTNKGRVAMKKILKYHPNIDMEPLFEWDLEGELTLKALPYVIAWFDLAIKEALLNTDGEKLSAIFQFAKAMPLLFVPPSHVKKDDKKKQKRSDNM